MLVDVTDTKSHHNPLSIIRVHMQIQTSIVCVNQAKQKFFNNSND